jgi:hypothetical protein
MRAKELPDCAMGRRLSAHLARGPPLWAECGDVQMGDGAQIEPADWHLANSAFWRWIGQARPSCGRSKGFDMGQRIRYQWYRMRDEKL